MMKLMEGTSLLWKDEEDNEIHHISWSRDLESYPMLADYETGALTNETQSLLDFLYEKTC
jgi:hypothetical protein